MTRNTWTYFFKMIAHIQNGYLIANTSPILKFRNTEIHNTKDIAMRDCWKEHVIDACNPLHPANLDPKLSLWRTACGTAWSLLCNWVHLWYYMSQIYHAWSGSVLFLNINCRSEETTIASTIWRHFKHILNRISANWICFHVIHFQLPSCESSCVCSDQL